MIGLVSLLLLSFTLTNGAQDVCLSDSISPTSSITVVSPNYPNKYDSSLNCTLLVKVPLDKNVLFTFNALRTESKSHDFVEIIIGSDKFVSGGEDISVPLGVQTIPNSMFLIRFESDVNFEYKGFSLTCTFVPRDLQNTITASNGVIARPNFSTSYIFTKQGDGWFRNVSIMFRSKCPEKSRIRAFLNSNEEVNACNVHSFHGSYITLAMSNEEPLNSIESIHFSSYRSRGNAKCNPDFDCGKRVCIPKENVCDGLYDCENDTDEDPANCNFPVETNYAVPTHIIPREDDAQQHAPSAGSVIFLVLLCLAVLITGAIVYVAKNRNQFVFKTLLT